MLGNNRSKYDASSEETFSTILEATDRTLVIVVSFIFYHNVIYIILSSRQKYMHAYVLK